MTSVWPAAEWTHDVHSLSACRHLLDSLPGQREGLMLRDAAFHRVKVKRRDYVLPHTCANGCDVPDYSWVTRSATSATLRMTVDRLCLNVRLRREAAEFVAYFPEHRARFEEVCEVIETLVKETRWLPLRADPRERDGARFVHEPRLAWVIGLLVT